MARATSMERIEKLRLQLEEAEKKEQEREAKKAEAQAERDRKKRETLTAKLDRLHEQQARVASLIAETEAALDALPSETFDGIEADLVS